MTTALLLIVLATVPAQSGLAEAKPRQPAASTVATDESPGFAVAAADASSTNLAPDTVVVCPTIFRDALKPWIDYRTAQGHRLVLVSNQGKPDDIRQRIREVAQGGRLRFVVLVGDASPDTPWQPAAWSRCVPVHYAKAKINVLWGSEPQIATDNWYAMPDDRSDEDPRPGLAIGRLTADTPDELRQMVAKILAYERSTDFGPWRQQLNFVAGVGGFGPVADMVLETTAQYFLTQSIPSEYQVSMTYGSWRSPYCPDPRLFRQTTLERLNEGSLFWVYIGHGYHLGLDGVEVPGGQYPILTAPDSAWLNCRHGRPIALFLACYTGAIDAQRDCLAETMFRAPGGPVAILAGSRVTMPYAMTVMATNLTDECFRKHRQTIGEAVLRAKQNMLAKPADSDQRRTLLDTVARVISPAPNQLAAERAEHVLLFNLIGDPMLRLRYPTKIELPAPATVAAGRTLEITGRCPIDGNGVIELIMRRDRLPMARPDRSRFPQSSETLSEFQETYQRANDRQLQAVAVEVRDGRYLARLAVPRGAEGACHLRMFVEGADGFACGTTDVSVTSRKP